MKKEDIKKWYIEGTRIVIDPVYNCIHLIKGCKTGVVCGIDDDGEMLIKWDDGGESFINCDRTRLHKININDVPVRIWLDGVEYDTLIVENVTLPKAYDFDATGVKHIKITADNTSFSPHLAFTDFYLTK